jgi:hypothetical protein
MTLHEAVGMGQPFIWHLIPAVVFVPSGTHPKLLWGIAIEWCCHMPLVISFTGSFCSRP